MNHHSSKTSPITESPANQDLVAINQISNAKTTTSTKQLTNSHQVAVIDLLNVITDKKACELPSFNLSNNPLFAQPRVTNALTLMAQLHTLNCQSIGVSDDKTSAQPPTYTQPHAYSHTLLLGTHGMGKTTFVKAWLQTHVDDFMPLPFIVFVDTQSPFAVYHLPITIKTHSSLQSCLDDFWQSLSTYLLQDNHAKKASKEHVVFKHLQALAKLLPMPPWQKFTQSLQHSIQNSPKPSSVSLEQIKKRFCIYLAPFTAHLPPIETAQRTTLIDVFGGMILPTHAFLANNFINSKTTSHIKNKADVNISCFPHWQMGKIIKAHGGFLLIRLADLLAQPALRQQLYDVLTTGYLPISYYSITQQPLAYQPNTPSLPLAVTLIGVGESDEFESLCDIDPSFAHLFAIRAEFDDAVTQTANHQSGFAQLVYQQLNTFIQDHLKNTVDDANFTPISNHISSDAIWQLYRHFVRLSEHNRLQVHLRKLHHLIQTIWVSTHHNPANTNNLLQIQATDVISAIKSQQLRTNYLKSLYWQDIIQGQQQLHTQGWQIGRINALTVIDYADAQFGMPIQLTAVIEPHIGHGDIIDIEREVELGGDLHAKGMLIMSHFLKSTFSPFCPLNFTASLAVEQNYGEIDGDSATLAQACALLSALGDIAIYQGIAVTGSMNQLGELQAVGGINEKVESFFDLCQQQATGQNDSPIPDNQLMQGSIGNTDSTNTNRTVATGNTQGVIIPKANIIDLVLDDRVIEAVSAGRFFIYAVSHISEAMTILTKMPYRDKTKKGNISKHCLQGQIIKRLKQWQDDESS